MLGPAVHSGKDTAHNTLSAMCNAPAWPQQCWKSLRKSCANGSNIIVACARLSDSMVGTYQNE